MPLPPSQQIDIYNQVRKTVNQQFNYNWRTTKSDLAHDIFISMLDCVEKLYDPDKGSLETFVRMKTRYYMKTMISRGTEENERKLRKIEQAQLRLIQKGQEITDETLCEESGLSPHQIRTTYDPKNFAASYEEFAANSNGGDLYDYQKDVLPEDQLSREESFKELFRILRDRLTFEQYTIFILKYHQGYSFAEIGECLGLSADAIKSTSTWSRKKAKSALIKN